mmetsp:Transcript_68629/g.146956  ORF Transcript_68629/g.146956 Transcript_68629/m.146956 type:complete len:1911 (+) Transcript_68629:89-5821(+)
MDAAGAKRRKAGLDEHRGGAGKSESQGDKENAGSGACRNRKAGAGLGENGVQKRSVEETYQKKSQVEHILLRPDSYVGSTERQSQEHFVFDDASGRMVKRKLEYVPALFKIFDEIVVNAADNLVRCASQDTIRIEVNAQKGYISVWNNGSGIPVEMHREHGCYVPELIFGQLLTSDNYDDSERKVTGGRNGYGAKLTNIFSSKFILETADSNTGKLYKQVWEKNMNTRNDPQIKSGQKEDFTKVTFYPDLRRFAMSSLEEDIVALMRRRAYDVAASTHGRCTVHLDGKRLDVKSFQDYVGLYLAPDAFRVCEVVNDRWEVAIGLTDGSGFQQVSFVNSICTSRGGTHVNYVGDQVVNVVLDKVLKQKGGGLAVKAQTVKGYIWVFVNCLIENPAFDSQTKETLTSKRERFGSACVLPEQFMEAILESGIVDTLLEWSKQLGKSELAQHLNRSDLGMQKRLFGVPKLEDANRAGTKESGDCTLILTEGDSAKALAVAGLSVVGRDHYGVFPLRGKLRNVRDLTVKQMLENKEIDQVMKILALDASKTYADTKGLRYGSIMIMTDQDHDGSHIKGLIINFVQHWFPSLLQVPGFLKEFVTPIVKVTRGDETHTFFTIPEYTNWKEENDDGRGWKCKYYKGLGTSTSVEAKEYFSDIDNHEIKFSYAGSEDDDLIDMAFNSKRADDRKKWIGEVEEGTFVDHSQPVLSYNDFIKKELVLFAKYDVERAVPSVIDGMKPGQRKVLFGVFKRKLTGEVKVAQLSGYVAEHSAYHHGEASLQGTIVNMAQNFVGSNNINLLMPCGQFGTRLQGGKDHAAARYIFTKLSRVARCMFPEDDDAVLEYLSEEGINIEPTYYCPVIPLLLVNGSNGIGTGWSTSVPNFNPRDIIANIRRYLRREPMESMIPWYRGFKGSVTQVPETPGKYDVTGVAMKRGRVRLEITELPIQKWTQDYKEWLLEMLPKSGAETRATVTEVREYHTENSVHFVLSMTPDKLAEAERRGVEKTFHLRSSISTTNMWCFDADGNIKKYETPEDILTEFAPVRLSVYAKRKAHLVAKMERELRLISNRLKFVQLVVSGRLDVEKKKSAVLCAEMRRHGLQMMCEINEDGHDPSAVEEAGPLGFKYLLSMKLWSLTEDKVEALARQHQEKEAALEVLRGTSLEVMWERDLKKLEEALDVCDAEDAKEAEAAAKMAAKLNDNEDILQNRQCVLVLSRNFRAKRVRTSEWKAGRRGAKLGGRSLLDKKVSKKGSKNLDENGAEGEEGEEEVEEQEEALAGVFCCHDFDALLVFSEEGQVYMLQALDVPLAKKASARGSELKEFLPELGNSRIAAMITVPQNAREHAGEFVVLVSAGGLAKKVPLDRFRGLRPGKGAPAMKLVNGDKLRWAHRASANCALVMATATGMLLRFSLGQDWQLSTQRGPGRCAQKLKNGLDDHIAGCGISEMTEQEIANLRKKMEQKAAARAATGAPAAGDEGEGEGEDDDEAMPAAAPEAPAIAAAPAMSPAAARRRSAAPCDDDDSDNEAMAEAAPKAAPAAAAAPTATGADGEDSEKEAEDDEEDAEAVDAAATETASGRQSVLLVTEAGMGLRMPLSCPRIGLRKRGQRGLRVMKVADSDEVIGVCIVSDQGHSAPPAKPRTGQQIFVAEKMGETQEGDVSHSQPAQQATDGSQPTEGSQAVEGEEPKGFARAHALQERFKTLPEAEQQEYQNRADEERQRYAELMEEYQKQDHEEILLGSTGGLIKRVTTGGIPTSMKCNKGRSLAKLPAGDQLCAVAVLSSMDGDKENEAAGAANICRPPAAPARRGPRRGKSGDVPGSPHGKEGSESQRLHLRMKTRASLCGKLGKRGRLSLLCASPRLSTPGRSSRNAAKLSIVKPKLRLLKARPRNRIVSMTVDIAAMAARHNKAGAKRGGR